MIKGDKLIEIQIHVVRDRHGNIAEGVTSEGSDGLFLCGLLDDNGVSQTFENEAWHVGHWAGIHGFVVETHYINLNLSQKSIDGWGTTVFNPR